MVTKQDELVVLIRKTINKQTKFKINKCTSRDELVNEAYIYIMQNSKYLDKFKDDPARERGYIVRMVKTAIAKFYIAIDVIKLPPQNRRSKKWQILDTENEAWGTDTANKVEEDYAEKEKDHETELWGDFFKDAFTTLSNVETYILENRYYYDANKEKKTLEEIATELHISRVRVFQLEEMALEKLFNYYLNNKTPDEQSKELPNLLSY